MQAAWPTPLGPSRPSLVQRAGRLTVGLLAAWAAARFGRCPACLAWGDDVEPACISNPRFEATIYSCRSCGHLWHGTVGLNSCW
jgi:hypothetical protein